LLAAGCPRRSAPVCHEDVEGLSVTAREGESVLGDPVGQHQDAGCLDVECADR
jgi:hypothetical protein